MLNKNDEFETLITDMSDEGLGIGRSGSDGFIWFIKDTVIGDRIIAAATKIKKSYGFARLVKVIEPSPDRVAPACGIAARCGGCQLQQLGYRAQLKYKENKVKNALTRIGGFSVEEIAACFEPITGMASPLRYRCKSVYPIGRDRDGRIAAGFYAGRTHSIIECRDCLIGQEENSKILDCITDWMQEMSVAPYDEATREGVVRHVLIRKGRRTGEIMVCLVINADGLPAAKTKELVRRLTGLNGINREHGLKRLYGGNGLNNADGSHKLGGVREAHELDKVNGIHELNGGIRSISLSVNMRDTNVIIGDRLINLYGPGYIEDRICEVGCTADRDDAAKGYDAAKKHDAAVSDGNAAANDRPASVSSSEGISVRISPQSFFQVNPEQMERLYSTALEYAGLTGNETVWDVYCGVGSIGLFMARHAGKIYGVEVIPEAVENARENATLNGIGNAEYFAGRAEEVLPQWYDAHGKNISIGCGKPLSGGNICAGSGKLASCGNTCAGGDKPGSGGSNICAGGDKSESSVKPTAGCAFASGNTISGGLHLSERGLSCGSVTTSAGAFPDVIVVDPPRKGCDEACLETIIRMSPQRVVYVSCDPATLSRDLKYLCSHGYKLERIRPCDMFPQTIHVETVCLLSKLNVNHHIEVEITMDELDLTAAESKATYDEIKAYVLEKFGFKVSQLYIAQIKRKCGIIERKNYNQSKKEDAKVPKCPPEKEAAIMDALKHFQMIP